MNQQIMAASLLSGVNCFAKERAAQRFDVHARNFVGGLIGALEQSFPVVHALTGDAYFAALACDYIRAVPPRSPVLARYGADFAAYVETLPVTESLPYLADIARLEYARIRAYHAVDADIWNRFTHDDVAALLPQPLAPHPSLTTIRSAHPIDLIWQAHQPAKCEDVTDWSPHFVLVYRTGDIVVHEVLDGFAASCFELVLNGQAVDSILASFDEPAMASRALQYILKWLLAEVLIVSSTALAGTKNDEGTCYAA
jgi:hypothetical protein